MKYIPTLFLKFVIVLFGIAVFAGMIFFPQTEGRAANLDLISIYTDPFIIYIYIASIPFFVALYQTFKLLGYIDKKKTFSEVSVNIIKNIKFCAIATIGFILGAQAFIMFAGEEDGTGPIALGIYTIFIICIVISALVVFERLLQDGIRNKLKTI